MANIHFLHIPKTGGTAFKNAVRGKEIVVTHGHGFTFQDVVEMPQARCIFFIRDVITRYTSRFNSRLRMGKPYTFAKWDEGEKVAFSLFATPNDLAESLSSECLEIKRQALCAIKNIWHTRFPLYFWLHSTKFLETNKDRILYIGKQESYDKDFKRIMNRLGIDSDKIKPPEDDTLSHKTPLGFSTKISELGKKNILNYYKEDLEILEWCDDYRKFINDFQRI